jgi:RimJ/RimL family protein N-acetyltransferase
MESVTLRDVEPGDLSVFFEQMRDPEAVQMAAFTAADPDDRQAFDRHWARILGEPNILIKTVLVDGQVAGSVISYDQDADLEVSYWIDRAYWGQGVATQALAKFLKIQTHRPLYGRAAKDNVGSVKVMLKNGFKIVGEDKGFANALGRENVELVLMLAAEDESLQKQAKG